MLGTISGEMWYRAKCVACGCIEDHRDAESGFDSLDDFGDWLRTVGRWGQDDAGKWMCTACANNYYDRKRIAKEVGK